MRGQITNMDLEVASLRQQAAATEDESAVNAGSCSHSPSAATVPDSVAGHVRQLAVLTQQLRERDHCMEMLEARLRGSAAASTPRKSMLSQQPLLPMLLSQQPLLSMSQSSSSSMLDKAGDSGDWSEGGGGDGGIGGRLEKLLQAQLERNQVSAKMLVVQL